MKDKRHVTLFHAPNSRSISALLLLEELGASYDRHVLDLNKGTQRQPEYLAINPMGKVPAIKHVDSLITEQVAIYLYMADLYPEAGLAPAIGDPDRGPYLRWMVYYAACFEPAIYERSQKREPGPARASPFGDFDTVVKTITDQLARGPYVLGQRHTAADLLWGMGLTWTTRFQLMPLTPPVKAYVERFAARPALARVQAIDAALAAQAAA
jgi:glutathione S-transferase